MKKVYPYLKNKFILASVVFFVFALFLDENDIFTIFAQNKKLNQLEAKKVEMRDKLDRTINTLDKLKYTSEIERFAREEKYFKKDDEDVFVIFKEGL